MAGTRGLQDHRLPKLTRQMPVEIRVLEVAGDGDEKVAGQGALYEVSASSEFPVQRFFGKEILSHKNSAVNLRFWKKGASVREEHRDGNVAVIEKGWLDTNTGNLRAHVRFSRRQAAVELEQDVLDKIVSYVSVGYTVQRAKLLKKGATFQDDEWFVSRWTPMELSFVGIPADPTVGVGRSGVDGSITFPVEIESGELPGEERKMASCEHVQPGEPACEKCRQEEEEKEPKAAPAAGDPPKDKKPLEPAPVPRSIAVGPSRETVASILRMARANDMLDKVDGWLERDLNQGQVAQEILNGRSSGRGSAQPASEVLDVIPEKDRSRYSYSRAIMGGVTGNLDGLEGEVHAEIKRKVPDNYTPKGGIFVPLRLHDRPFAKRAGIDSKTGGAGAETVFDRPGELIELLRAESIVARLGARMLAGLQGPVAFPKQTGAATAYWVGENPGADVADSNVTTGIVNLAPKTLQASTSWSRQLLAQQNIDNEAMVRDDLAAIHSLAIDLAALHGLGAAGEPTGIYVAPDVQVKAMGGVPDYIKVVDMTAKVADSNALRGSLGWAATPLMAGKLKTVPVLAAAAHGFVWTGTVQEGEMAGYRSIASTQVSRVLGAGSNEHGMIFGNWNDLLVGMWGALELIVDPFRLKKQGMIEVTSFQMADVVLRHGESFIKATGATTS